MSSYTYHTPISKKAILVGVQRQLDKDAHFTHSLDELGGLIQALDWSVEGRLTQKRAEARVSTVIGQGKLKELVEWVEALEEQAIQSPEAHKKTRRSLDRPAYEVVVVFNETLTPMQFRILEEHLHVPVLDRTGIILQIFQRRAQTREAKIQVELAHLNYMALRMADMRGQNMDQQAGGIGAKGQGEAAHQLEKRWVRDRTTQLRRTLQTIEQQRHLRCTRRKDVEGVALVGYTNAGKSSWMRALTGESVVVEDQLFATLDTTVRTMPSPHSKPILLSDTVGFIEDLPHELVASFRSTLEEARQASLLIHVVDASNEHVENQMAVTRSVLRDLEADGIPYLLLLNKADRLSDERRETLEWMFPKAHFVSAHNPSDVQSIREQILEFFAGECVEETLCVPYADYAMVSEICEKTEVLSLQHEDEGTYIKLRTFESVWEYIVRQLNTKQRRVCA